eukprot:322922-Hanusia_phi.AAC.1
MEVIVVRRWGEGGRGRGRGEMSRRTSWKQRGEGEKGKCLTLSQVPLLTLPGSMQPARVAASLLLHPQRALSELVARDESDFVMVASKLIQ